MRPVARKPLRRLVADGQLYLYSAGWSPDLDGERLVCVALYHAEVGREQQPRGKPIRANFLPRAADHPTTAAATHPPDIRAVLDHARAIGWDGRREGWLLPACGLERPDLVLATPTRLRAWARERPLFVAHVEEGDIADHLARALQIPPLPEARGAAEAAWRDDRRYLLRSRWGQYVHVYTRDIVDMIAVLTTLQARAPQLGVSVTAIPAPRLTADDPPIELVPPAQWSGHPGATRHRGLREHDLAWALPDPHAPGIEVYEYAPAEPDRPEHLRRWLSLRDAGSLERRFT